jgi:hypothetical protein
MPNGPNVHKIYQHLQLRDPPKFTQNGIFGVKINHLATLLLAAENGLGFRNFNWKSDIWKTFPVSSLAALIKQTFGEIILINSSDTV